MQDLLDAVPRKCMPDERHIRVEFLSGSTSSKNRRVHRALHPHLASCWHACCCSRLHSSCLGGAAHRRSWLTRAASADTLSSLSIYRASLASVHFPPGSSSLFQQYTAHLDQARCTPAAVPPSRPSPPHPNPIPVPPHCRRVPPPSGAHPAAAGCRR